MYISTLHIKTAIQKSVRKSVKKWGPTTPDLQLVADYNHMSVLLWA